METIDDLIERSKLYGEDGCISIKELSALFILSVVNCMNYDTAANNKPVYCVQSPHNLKCDGCRRILKLMPSIKKELDKINDLPSKPVSIAFSKRFQQKAIEKLCKEMEDKIKPKQGKV